LREFPVSTRTKNGIFPKVPELKQKVRAADAILIANGKRSAPDIPPIGPAREVMSNWKA